jgi:hypothetical protein
MNAMQLVALAGFGACAQAGHAEDIFVEPVRVIHEFRGAAAGGQFGWIAQNIGDVDGDGVDDLATSAPTIEIAGPRAGRIYTYSGATGELLWTADGQEGWLLGMGIDAAGDVNADGVPDVVTGAPNIQTGPGHTVVFSGVDGSVLLDVSVDESDDHFGRKVYGVGDLNGDGHGDLIAGAPASDAGGEGSGAAYVISGADGEILAKLVGEEAGLRFGAAVSGGMSGDRQLLVVGAPDAGENKGGRVYVYEWSDGEAHEAFRIETDEKGAELGGMFVSVVGDIDADGCADVYASDWAHAELGQQTGRIYVHSGATGERLYTLTGEAAGDGFGIGPARTGDVDGDGHADLIIGAWQHAGAAKSGGKSYLYSGATGELVRTYTCKVEGDTWGFDTSGMGDVDGDGAVDFLITSAWSGVGGEKNGRMFIISSKYDAE